MITINIGFPALHVSVLKTLNDFLKIIKREMMHKALSFSGKKDGL